MPSFVFLIACPAMRDWAFKDSEIASPAASSLPRLIRLPELSLLKDFASWTPVISRRRWAWSETVLLPILIAMIHTPQNTSYLTYCFLQSVHLFHSFYGSTTPNGQRLLDEWRFCWELNSNDEDHKGHSNFEKPLKALLHLLHSYFRQSFSFSLRETRIYEPFLFNYHPRNQHISKG